MHRVGLGAEVIGAVTLAVSFSGVGLCLTPAQGQIHPFAKHMGKEDPSFNTILQSR